MLCVALVVVTVAFTGCSGLGDQADATVKITAKDGAQALRLRQDLLDQSASWGGVRVGEKTTEKEGDTSLTFSLPGHDLDAALGAIHRLDAQIDSTDIAVERTDVDRTATTASSTPSARNPTDGQILLRVDVSSRPQAGAGALLRLVMAVFSVIGMVATALWVTGAWKRRFSRQRPERRRSIVDISDPPTAETPTVRGDPW